LVELRRFFDKVTDQVKRRSGESGTPLWGDYAIVKVKSGAAVPEMVTAGLFDEHWQLVK